MQAVVLAAGKGTRLRPLTNSTPKALVDICGRPLMAHILDALPDEISEIILVVGYLREAVMKAVGTSWNGIPVRYVVQEDMTGTGVALLLAKHLLHDRFLVVNGDDLYDRRDLERLLSHPLAMLVQRTKQPIKVSALVDEAGDFRGLEAVPPAQETKIRVCGAYLLDERFFRYPLVPVSFEVHGKHELGLPHTIVEMAKDLDVKTEEAAFWHPVGTSEELEAARTACSAKK
jgi:UDP-N-acetylglucosamine diphosphorylase / glucose-1-phosphate thymidylyltransferase / UDP-N-acetylgalactosamine diphosphorylase / glucosamine-1-phosphate N-acetyltransferase / galactosamine-1-phosphate N-acetyltransferase